MFFLQILRSGGANILTRKPDPESIPEDSACVPFHVSPSSSLARCSHIIVYQVKLNDLNYRFKAYCYY
jgi:hypothetical protein